MRFRGLSYRFSRFSTVCLLVPVVLAAAGRVTGFTLRGSAGDDDELFQQARSLFPSLPKDVAGAEFPVAPERVRLGRMLFFEPRISDDGTGSCVRCGPVAVDRRQSHRRPGHQFQQARFLVQEVSTPPGVHLVEGRALTAPRGVFGA